MSKTGWRYLLNFILCLSLISLISVRGEGVELMGLRYRSSDNGSRITLDLNGMAKYEITPAKGKILIILKGCRSGIGSIPNRFKDKLVRSIDVKPSGEDLSITIDLREKANLSAFMTRSPYKLIVDLYPLPRPKPKLKPSLAPAKITVKRPSPSPSKTPLQAAAMRRPTHRKSTPSQPKPKEKPKPKKPSPSVTYPPPEDKSDAGSSSPDLASMLSRAERERTGDVEMPKVGIGIPPLLVAQLFFNLILLAALYLLWRKIDRLASGMKDKGKPSGVGSFSEVLDEIVDLQAPEITEDRDDPKVRKVKRMLKEGLSVDEIAKKTGIPKGEVELISSLSGI
ncbi:TPA: DUF2802 domain-containing protein [Candidatus Poribacteria bacterium]|nr:DUF2802 domain-containing protein [Candidatus Poribacteria bacterium]HEX29896.1 DUF2802 domain-containing protein [Candidatus Poribacteria bacterium]